eukprot:m.204881 g.204881  ORF g.204881 m.204881 type:complete len:50 (-) comp26039_c0_seq6:10298-10447(-)
MRLKQNKKNDNNRNLQLRNFPHAHNKITKKTNKQCQSLQTTNMLRVFQK